MAGFTAMKEPRRTYEDFTPKCTIKDEHSYINDKVTIKVELSGKEFKREHLRVQLHNSETIRIVGERPPLGADGRWMRFVVEHEVPDGCDAGAMRARFENNDLIVTIPRVIGEKAPAVEPKAAEEKKKPAETSAGGEAADQDEDAGHASAWRPGHAAASARPPGHAGALLGGRLASARRAGHTGALLGGRGSARRADADAKEAEEEDATEENAGAAMGEPRRPRNIGVAPTAARPAALFDHSAKDTRPTTVWVWAIFAVALALVGAGLYARFMDPIA